MPDIFVQHPALFYLSLGLSSLLAVALIALVSAWLPRWLITSWDAEARELLELKSQFKMVNPWVSFWRYSFSRGGEKEVEPFLSGRTSLISLLGLTLIAVTIWKTGLTPYAGLLILWMLALLTLSVIDLETYLLPDVIVLPFLWLGLITNALFGTVGLQEALWGVVLGYLMLWLPASLYRLARGVDGMGQGDFKLLAMLGAWMGWQQLPLLLLVACVIGVIGGIAQMMLKSKLKRLPTEYIAFGPYLAIAAAVVQWT
jgi:leader peptidase (prepilin peptidase)/N-methyltransferase